MRQPSSNIHELVQSLTKEEKKRVNIHLKGLGKKGTEHLRLLKAIEKQEVYDEASLKKIFRAALFSQLKKRLYDLIMGTLVQLYQKKDIHHELFTGLQYFRVLKNKGLKKQAREVISRLRDLALEYDFMHYVVFINQEILVLEDSIFLYKGYDNTSSKELFHQYETHFENYKNLIEYGLLKSKMIYHTRKKTLTEKELTIIEKLAQDPLLENIDHAQSTLAKLDFYLIQFILGDLKNDPQKTYDSSLQICTILETFLSKITSPKLYMFSFYNVIYSAIKNNVEESVIEDFFDKKERNNLRLEKGDKQYAEVVTFDLKIYWYTQIGNVKRGNELIQELKSPDIKYIESSYFNCAKICFLDKNYNKALDLLEETLEKSGKDDYLRHLYHFLKLLIYFEMNNFSILESLIRSLYRKFYSDKEKYSLELILVNGFGKLIKSDPNKQQQLFESMHQQLLKLKYTATYNDHLILNYTYIFQWIKSKAQNKSLVELLKTDPYTYHIK